MTDYEMMSPAEREAAIRSDYRNAQRNVNALVRRLTDEYAYLSYLRDQIAEIDVYGAEDFFCKPANTRIRASLARNGYDF